MLGPHHAATMAILMKLRYHLLVPVALIIIIAAWIAVSWPRKVDMAEYAPADSIVYLECNSITSVADTITGSDAWQSWAANFGLPNVSHNRWLYLAASFGLAPAPSVILSRAQVAVVMLNLDASEENTTLSIKPEGALIIETHTAAWRTRPVAEATLQQFAERTYGAVSPKHSIEDAEYIEWDAPSGDRKIVAAIEGTLVVIGNSKRAVQRCLDAHRKPEASLRDEAGLRQMRARIRMPQSLTFGYVSAGNAARLVSWGAPLLFGREPGDATFEQIVTRNASRVLGAIGWTSRAEHREIEDRFVFNLEPSVISRLRPAFKVGQSTNSVWTVVPYNFATITVYRAQNPALAWDALRGVTGQFDAVSAVLFSSVMKAALVSYGIENPDKFLNAVGPEVATIKVNSQGEGSVLIARVIDRPALEQIFKVPHSRKGEVSQAFDFELPDADKKFSAAFASDYLLVGARADVSVCLDAERTGETIASQNKPKTLDPSLDSSASIVTYSNDSERVQNFFSLLNSLRSGNRTTGVPALGLDPPFSTTETNLDDLGLDRRTRSPLGQFSTLVGLLKRD